MGFVVQGSGEEEVTSGLRVEVEKMLVEEVDVGSPLDDHHHP